jgi:hypothetical protein
VNANHKSDTESLTPEKAAGMRDELSAHLAFRRIIVHESTEDAEPEAVRVHFHYRGHSKHISARRRAA